MPLSGKRQHRGAPTVQAACLARLPSHLRQTQSRPGSLPPLPGSAARAGPPPGAPSGRRCLQGRRGEGREGKPHQVGELPHALATAGSPCNTQRCAPCHLARVGNRSRQRPTLGSALARPNKRQRGAAGPALPSSPPDPLMAETGMGSSPVSQNSAAMRSALPTFSHLFTASTTAGRMCRRIGTCRAGAGPSTA